MDLHPEVMPNSGLVCPIIVLKTKNKIAVVELNNFRFILLSCICKNVLEYKG
jgi:hypothetical protein